MGKDGALARSLSGILDILLSKVSIVVGASAVGIMVVVVTVGVIARYVFNSPLTFVTETTGLLLVAIVLWSASDTLKVGGHVSVDIITTRLPHRVAAWVRLVCYLVATAFTVELSVETAKMVALSFKLQAHSWGALYLPRGPIQLLMLIGICMFTLQFMVETAGATRALWREKGRRHESRKAPSSEQEVG